MPYLIIWMIVSGQYPDIVALSLQSQVAGKLSFRSPEIEPQLLGNPKGKPRGNPNDKDGYYLANISISFNLAGGYELEFDEYYKQFAPNFSAE